MGGFRLHSTHPTRLTIFLTFSVLWATLKTKGDVRMSGFSNRFGPRYIIDEKGRKTSVVIGFNKYKNLLELIEDLEDTRDLLKAELEATGFTPYEKFRKKWLSPRFTKYS